MPIHLDTTNPASTTFASRLATYAFYPSPSSAKSTPIKSAVPPFPLGNGFAVDRQGDAGPSTPLNGVRRTPRHNGKRKVRYTPEDEESDEEAEATKDGLAIPDGAGNLGTDDDSGESMRGTGKKRLTSGKVPKKDGGGKKARPFASPEVYRHLKVVDDVLQEGLDIVFCGINPGQRSSTMGHHFAHPTNKFWRALHLSGLTDRLLSPAEDHLLPAQFSFGLTNLCGRPTAEQSELSTLEMRLDVPDLTAKILRFRPRIVCLVGKKIWDEYEFVASKTAGPACVPGIASSCQNGDIKPGLESFSQVQDVDVKVEPHDEEDGVKVESVDQKQAVSIELGLASPVSPRRWTSVSSKQKRTTKASTSAKAKFDWSQPRPLRLPWSTAGGRTIHGYTYFWVVPNTSGLVRVTLSEQVVLFGHLRSFCAALVAGNLSPVGWRDIDIRGVEETVEGIRRAAISKGALSSSNSH